MSTVVSKLNGKVKRKRGRPTVRTAETAKIILENLELGLRMNDACAAAGISFPSFSDWKNTVPEFAAQVDQAILRSKKNLLALIIKAAEDHWQAAAWMAERRWPEEFSTPAVQFQFNQQVNVNDSGSAELMLGPVALEEARRQLDEIQRIPGTEQLDLEVASVEDLRARIARDQKRLAILEGKGAVGGLQLNGHSQSEQTHTETVAEKTTPVIDMEFVPTPREQVPDWMRRFIDTPGGPVRDTYDSEE
jgi:hypothetical protein